MKKLISVIMTMFIAVSALTLPASAAGKIAAPTGVTAKVKSDTTVRVSWDKVADAFKYTVYYSTDGKTYKGYATTQATYATVKKLTTGKKYYFAVKAADKNGNKSAYSKAVTATPKISDSTTVKESSGAIKVTQMPGTVTNNDYAILRITGKPNTKYKLSVYYSTTVSKAEGTGTKTSDANGIVMWKWKVGANTKAGEHKIVISGGGDTLTTKFETVKE